MNRKYILKVGNARKDSYIYPEVPWGDYDWFLVKQCVFDYHFEYEGNIVKTFEKDKKRNADVVNFIRAFFINIERQKKLSHV